MSIQLVGGPCCGDQTDEILPSVIIKRDGHFHIYVLMFTPKGPRYCYERRVREIESKKRSQSQNQADVA